MFQNDPRFACVRKALRRRDFAAAQMGATELLQQCSRAEERAFLFNKRGVARIALEEREPARSDFNEALREIPNYPPALTNLGNLLFDQGEYEAAIAQYERAIAQDAQYPVAYVNLAAAYKKLRRFDEAVRTLRHAYRLEARGTTSASASWRSSPKR